jgi:hypothetical protein
MMTPELETKRKSILEEKRYVSSKISDLCRYIGFGLVAVVYSLLTSDSDVVIKLYEKHITFLLIVAAFGVSTIVLDYLQFLGGYYAVNSALKNEEGEFLYDDNWFSYKLRRWAFYAKQVTTIFGALLLLFSLLFEKIN